MVVNRYGEIVNDLWYRLEKQYPYVTLHEFVVMPNHIHGIIQINRADADMDIYPNPKIKSLSELMGAYKTTSSKQIHLSGYSGFVWHRSFHDHIIRDERSFRNISHYIQNNPSSWDDDKFNDQ
jgi:putative transposase